VKFGKLDLTIPTPVEIIAGLDVEKDVGLTLAREAAVNVRRELAHATQRLSDAGAIVSSTKAAVAGGRASTGDLEAALRSQSAAALVLPAYQRRAIEADSAIVVALTHAKASVVAEAGRRRDALQATADKILPALSALRVAEEALDAAVQGALGDRYVCVTAVTWPRSNEDDAIQSHGRDLARAVGVPRTEMYPRRAT
jgi:hypothetical protein